MKSARPSDIGTTIKAELKISEVIQATTSKRTMRRTKLYLLKNASIVGQKNASIKNRKYKVETDTSTDIQVKQNVVREDEKEQNRNYVKSTIVNKLKS